MWVNLHKKRIKNKDYYYHTVRNSEGGTKTLYLGSDKKVAKKKAKDLGLSHKESDFSFFKHGPFFLLALSLLMLSLVGFLTLFFVPDYEVVQLGPGKDLSYEYSSSGRGVGVDIISGFDSSISVEITVIGSEGKETYTKEVEPGDSRIVVPSEVGKVEDVIVDVVSVFDEPEKEEIVEKVTEKSEETETRSTTPEVSDVVLSSSSGNNGVFDNLTVTYEANENTQTINTDWRVDGESIALANLPLDVEGGSDFSTYYRDITYHDSIFWNSFGKIGGSYYFPYEHNYQKIGIPLGYLERFLVDGSYTLEAWIYPEDTGSARNIFVNGFRSSGGCCESDDICSEGYRIYLGTDGKIKFMGFYDVWSGGSSTCYSYEVVSNEDWTHVALTYEDHKVKIYINGGLDKTCEIEQINSSSSATELRIGSKYYSYVGDTCNFNQYSSFKGYIDEVKIFDKVLSEEQIYEEYLSGENENPVNTLLSSETQVEDIWSVAVTPIGIVEEGETVISNELEIINTPPNVPTLTLSEEEIYVGIDPWYAECTDNGDPENDLINLSIYFTDEDEELVHSCDDNMCIAPSLWASFLVNYSHEIITVSCEACDAYGCSEASQQIEVVNSAPVASPVDVYVSVKTDSIDINLEDYVSDVDEDSLTFYDEGNNVVEGGVYTFIVDEYDVGQNDLSFTVDDGYGGIIDFTLGVYVIGLSISHEGEYYDDNHQFTATILDFGQSFNGTTCQLSVLNSEGNEIINDSGNLEEGLYSYSTQFLEDGDGDYTYSVSCTYEGGLFEEESFTIIPYNTSLIYDIASFQEIYYIGNEVTFNVVYSTSEELISDADCHINIGDEGVSMTEEESFYSYSTNFNTQGEYFYELYCDKIGHSSSSYSDSIIIWEEMRLSIPSPDVSYGNGYTEVTITPVYTNLDGDNINGSICTVNFGDETCESINNEGCAVQLYNFGLTDGNVQCSVPGQYYDAIDLPISTVGGIYIESPTTNIDLTFDFVFNDNFTLTGDLIFTNNGEGWAYEIEYEVGDILNQISPSDGECGSAEYGLDCQINDISIQVEEGTEPAPPDNPYTFKIVYNWINNDGSESEEEISFQYSPNPILNVNYSPTELSFQLNNSETEEQTISIENKGNIDIELDLSVYEEIVDLVSLSTEQLDVEISGTEDLTVTITVPEDYEGKTYISEIIMSFDYDDENQIYEEIPITIEVIPNISWQVLGDNLGESVDLFESDIGYIVLENLGNVDLILDLELEGDFGISENIQDVEGEYTVPHGGSTNIQFSLTETYQEMNVVWNLSIIVSDQDENVQPLVMELIVNPWNAQFSTELDVDLNDLYVAPDQSLNLGKIIVENTAEQELGFSIENENFEDSEITIEANTVGELTLEWLGNIEGNYPGEFTVEDENGNSIPFSYNITVVDFDVEDVLLDEDQDLRGGEEIELTILTTLEDAEYSNFELISVTVLDEEEEIGDCEITSEGICVLPEIDALLEQKDLGLEVVVRDLEYNIIDSYTYEYINYADTYPPTINIIMEESVDPGFGDSNLEIRTEIEDNVEADLSELTTFMLIKDEVEVTEIDDCSSELVGLTTEIVCSLNVGELYDNGELESNEIYTVEVSTSDYYGNLAVNHSEFLVIDLIYNIEMEFTDAQGNELTGVSLMFCLPGTDSCSDPITTAENENSLTISEIGNSIWDLNINYQGIVDFTFYDVDLSQLEEHSNFFSLDFFDYSGTFIPESLVNNYISLYGVVVESEIFDLGTINELHMDGTFFDEDTPYWYIGYVGWLTEHMNYVVCHDWSYSERTCNDLESIEIISEEYSYDSEEGVFSYVPPLEEEDLEGDEFSAYLLSINTCGNGDQESWETETSCGADFADTYSEQPPSQPSGPSGGGGDGSSGGSQPQQQLSESLIFSLNKIEKELFPGEEAYELIHISSITEDVTSLDVEVSGEIQDLITVPSSIEIATNPDLIVNIAIPEDKDNGLYEGKISFTRADIYSEVLVEIRVLNSEYNLLSLDIDPLQDSVSAGNDISIETQVTNNGNNQNVDINLELLDLEDTETPLSEDNYTVEVLFDYTELLSLSTPSDLDEGFYYVKGKAIHSGVTGRGTISMAQIEVIRSVLNATFLGIKFKYYLLLISIALLLVGGFYSLEFVRQKTRRYKGKVDIKSIPRSADRAAFVGKVAETPINSYIGLDKLQTHTLIAGATGSGKTVGAMDVVEEALDKKVSVIVFDPTGQWTGYLRKSTQTNMLDRYRFFGMSPKSAKAYEGNIYKITDPKEQIDIKEHIKPGKITVFVVKDLKPKEIDVLVTTTVEQVFRANLPETGKLKLLMVYDEVHRLLSKFGGSGAGLIQLERGAREFRKWGVGLVLISQVLSDFIGDIKANIGNEIQFRTRYENDLKRIRMKYGSKYSQSVIREAIGTGMYVNAGYNKGLPYFVSFRPLKHNTFGLPAEELNKYTKYNKTLDDIRWKISQLKKAKVDVFDVEIELKLIDEKLSQGNFNMVDLYLESMKPNLDKIVKKHRRKIGRKKVETFTSKELKEILDRAKSMRKKYIKKAPKDLIPVTKEAKEEMAKEVERAKKKQTMKKLKKKKTKKVNNGKKTKERNSTKKRISRKSKKPR